MGAGAHESWVVPSHTLYFAGASPQVTVQVQGEEVLSEKMEPSSFQPIPQIKPQTPGPGADTPPGAIQELPLDLQVKEEPEVTEDPGEARQNGQGLKPSLIV